MTKAQEIFIKLAKKNDSNELALRIGGAGLLSGVIPLIPNYVFTSEKARKQHPVVSTLMGPAGAQGAIAKNTGKSTLSTTIEAGAKMGAPIGALGAAAIAVKHAPKMTPIAVLTGATAGAVTGSTGSALNYGLGHLFGKTKSKKKHK